MKHAKRPSATKSGPGRYHSPVNSGKAKKTNFAAALMAHWAAKRAESNKHKVNHNRRDMHGAVTLTGGKTWEHGPEHTRRIWLAGISAQRGF